tara:strand:- start:40 stop:435 length:396 start_codon:yes stop_codon:yes gene_type:complete
MGVESSLKNYMNQDWVKETIRKDSNPEKMRRTIENAFKRRVEKGSIVTMPGGGFQGSKESQARSKERMGTRDEPSKFAEDFAAKLQKSSGEKVTGRGLAGRKFGFFPTGRKKGGMVNSRTIAKKYFKGGMV